MSTGDRRLCTTCVSVHDIQDISIKRHQTESEWLVCRTEAGRVYYANRKTGASQWHKPKELGGTDEPVVPESLPVIPAGPPKPKTGSLPPPRPKTGSVPPPRPKSRGGSTGPSSSVTDTGNRELLGSLIITKDSSEEPSEPLDPTTGFGEWEVVVPTESSEPDTSEMPALIPLQQRELKRPVNETNITVGFNRTITKKNKRVTRQDD